MKRKVMFQLVAVGIVLMANSVDAQIAASTVNSGWKDDGTEVRLKTSTDDVGIGTTTPAGKLHVTGGNVIVDDNLGIGTVVPSQKLDVEGNARISGLVNCNTVDTDASGNLACGTDETGASGVGGSGTVNKIPQFTGATTLGDSAITQSGSNIGIGTMTPGAPLTVNGPMIRRIARVQGYLGDTTDNGALVGRSLTFTKTQSDTSIRVGWSDNFRTLPENKACRWEVRFNGAACTNPGGLFFDKYVSIGGGIPNFHEAGSFFGTCNGLPAGTYTIQGYVSPTPGYAAVDCYTGWLNQLFSIEAEEVY